MKNIALNCRSLQDDWCTKRSLNTMKQFSIQTKYCQKSEQNLVQKYLPFALMLNCSSKTPGDMVNLAKLLQEVKILASLRQYLSRTITFNLPAIYL